MVEAKALRRTSGDSGHQQSRSHCSYGLGYRRKMIPDVLRNVSFGLSSSYAFKKPCSKLINLDSQRLPPQLVSIFSIAHLAELGSQGVSTRRVQGRARQEHVQITPGRMMGASPPEESCPFDQLRLRYLQSSPNKRFIALIFGKEAKPLHPEKVSIL